ncbi:hypothetical protein [Amycolatopsis sp. cmx-8-4]|uniref:hypothetical protein n=1 Tax=Amycolatopsis sp. cmx-8-4 TaxID=2790947 RepID=UPI00397E18EE
MEPTTSLAQAQTSATDQVREAAAAVFPAGFTLEALPPQPLNCTDSSGKPTGQVQLGVGFWVNGIPAAQNGTYFDTLKAWWSSHGWVLDADNRPGDMFMNARRDGYLMSLQANVDNRLAIGNTTPCVWRNGTPTAHP